MYKWDRLDEPKVSENYGALWDEVSLTHVVVGRNMSQVGRHNWVPAEDFLHHGIDVREIIPVGKGGKTVSNNTIDLLLALSLSLRV